MQIEEINETIKAEQSGDQSALHELACPKRAVLHAMLVGFGVAFFQQANGSEVRTHPRIRPSGVFVDGMLSKLMTDSRSGCGQGVVYFTPTVLSLGGIKQGNAMYASTAAVGTCKAFFVGIALLTMDHVGRVKLLVYSSMGVSIALGLLAYAFTRSEPSVALAVLGLCGFMASFSVGWGPLSGVILAEVFPLRIRNDISLWKPLEARICQSSEKLLRVHVRTCPCRDVHGRLSTCHVTILCDEHCTDWCETVMDDRGSAVGIGWGINRLVSGTVALTFLPLNRGLGVAGTFFVFFVISLVALLFARYVVPETKGARFLRITSIGSRTPCCSVENCINPSQVKPVSCVQQRNPVALNELDKNLHNFHACRPSKWLIVLHYLSC
eukprot:9395231-Pyramimonas_sp.AAC.1